MVYVKADEQQSCYEEGMASAVVLRLWKGGTGSKMSLPAWQEKLVICFTHNMKLHATGFALGINWVWSVLVYVVAITEALKLS